MVNPIAKKNFEIYAQGIERLEELEKELKLLHAEKKFPSEVASIMSKLKHVSEIPQIEYELKKLEAKLSGKVHKRKSPSKNLKIEKLEEEIKKKVTQCSKFAPLSKEVVSLKLQIESLRKKVKEHEGEEKRKKDLLTNIHVDVDKVFDDTFNMSLNEIKAKLSEDIENKETEIQQELQNDLERRQKVFDEKYGDLEREFEEKYRRKVNEELNKEVSTTLNELLKKELAKKNKLSEQELNSLRKKLQMQFSQKEKFLRGHLTKNIEQEKKLQKEIFQERLLAEKSKLHKSFDSQIVKEVSALKEKEAKTQHELSNKMSSFSKLKEKLMEKMSIERKEMKEEFDSEKRREEDKLARKEEALRKKSEEIRTRLQREFDKKLSEAVKVKEEELKKKNSELEREIKDKIKSFYK